MNLSNLMKRYNIQPKGIIHFGGIGDEIEEYERLGFRRILIVQPRQDLFERLRAKLKERTRPHVMGVQCAIGTRATYKNVEGRLMPVRPIDTLLVELRAHPRLFNVIQSSGDADFSRFDLDGTETLKHLDIVGTHLLKNTGINLWQNPHGRFANEIFHHFFARRLAEKFGYTLHTAPWAGQALFGIEDALLEHELPIVEDHDTDPKISPLWRAFVSGNPEDGIACANRCIFGNFQYHTGLWRPDERKVFQDMYKPVPDLEEWLRKAFVRMMGEKKTLVVVHVRRGDYTDNHPGMFYRTPVASYLAWLNEIWPLLNKPLLYVASDDPNVVHEFKALCPVTERDMDIALDAAFYTDFWVMTQAHAMAISNSSFSFAAAMLNEALGLFPPQLVGRCVRPSRDGTMSTFAPWNDDVLLGRYDIPPCGNSEEECLKFLVNLLPTLDPKREGAFIEVGLGTFAWFFKAMSTLGFQCHAVEPAPTLELRKECGMNLTTLTEAVMSNLDGERLLYAGRGDDLNSIDPAWWGVDGGTVPAEKVASVRFDTFLKRANIRAIACLKLDVEGAEGEIMDTIPFGNNSDNGLHVLRRPLSIMFEYGGTPQAGRKGGWTKDGVEKTLRCLRILALAGYDRVVVVADGLPPQWMGNNEARDELMRFNNYPGGTVFGGKDYGNMIALLPALPSVVPVDPIVT